MTTSYSLSKPLISTPVPWWWNDAIAASRSFMLKPAFPSLACVPSDATISSTSSIGHSGKNDGRRSAPLDALQLPSNRPCASSQKRRSFGPASEAGGKKSAKSSCQYVYVRPNALVRAQHRSASGQRSRGLRLTAQRESRACLTTAKTHQASQHPCFCLLY